MEISSLKYQSLIAKFKFSIKCPPVNCTSIEFEVFRWVRSPIDEEIDFLPNHLYSEKMGIPPKKKISEGEGCRRCGISMFATEDSARNLFNSFAPLIQSKIGYTHIAKGVIDKSDGIATEIPSDGHFGFFQYEQSLLGKKFSVLSNLI